MSETVASVEQKLQRNIAVDAYRGFVMLLMMGEVLQFARVSASIPGNLIWRVLAYNQSHVEWVGMSLHDTIQPSFTFLVGVALPYSLRSRQKKGATFHSMLGHTIWRSFLLVALGIFLRSANGPITYFTFEDTLTQIGLGYTFAFLLTYARPRWQWIAFGGILFAYWLAWALYPAPGPNFDYAAVGVPDHLRQHLLTGFASHWNMNSNLGQAFDVWFLNLFPRTSPFLFNDGGYLTLSFIPTLGTMLLGVIAGRWSHRRSAKHSRAEIFARGSCVGCRWPVLSLHRNLPDRQAYLDTRVDAFQWWRMLFLSGRFFMGHRNQEASQHCVSAGRCRHELHRCILDRSLVRRVSREQLPDQFRNVRSEHLWKRRGAHSSGRSHPGRLLAHSLLDVPQQNLHTHLDCLLCHSTCMSIGDGHMRIIA